MNELKVQAYDLIVKKEALDNAYRQQLEPIMQELQKVNQEIAELYKKEKVVEPEVIKEDTPIVP